MAWFMRGVQSAVFHYASCAPCTGYSDGRKRRTEAKQARKAREKLLLEEPDTYHHPEPTGTNPFWGEEIAMGPGPPPRRARRTGTGSTRALTTAGTAGTQNSAISKLGSSSDDTLAAAAATPTPDGDGDDDDDGWNRKRYQREDEALWGLDEASWQSSPGLSLRPPRPRSSSYHCVRAPPVNELHPPVVSLPSPDANENRWMLQPPPSARVMAGKERATARSRSHSAASSWHVMPHARTPQVRPPSASSSRRMRRDTAISTRSTVTCVHSQTSYTASSDTIARNSSNTTTTPPLSYPQPSPPSPSIPDIKPTAVRKRDSRPALSTILSSDSNLASSSPGSLHTTTRRTTTTTDENAPLEKPLPPLSHRFSSPVAPSLHTSDLSSLNRLQHLVSPRALLQSRFITAPLVEAKIRLPPSMENITGTEERSRRTKQDGHLYTDIHSHGYADDSGTGTGYSEEEGVRVPFDNLRGGRDPMLRWSVDF